MEKREEEKVTKEGKRNVIKKERKKRRKEGRK